MGSSTTIQSHPPSSSALSSLQVQPPSTSPAVNSPNSSTSTVATTSTASPLIPVSASRDPSDARTNSGRSGVSVGVNVTVDVSESLSSSTSSSTIKEDSELSVATAVSFATPENSPFQPHKKLTDLSSSSATSTAIPNSTQTHGLLRQAAINTPPSQTSNPISISASAAIMSASGSGGNGNRIGNGNRNGEGNHTVSSDNSNLRAHTIRRTASVTPQEKCVKFQESRSLNHCINLHADVDVDVDVDVNKQGAAEPSVHGVRTAPLASAAASTTNNSTATDIASSRSQPTTVPASQSPNVTMNVNLSKGLRSLSNIPNLSSDSNETTENFPNLGSSPSSPPSQIQTQPQMQPRTQTQTQQQPTPTAATIQSATVSLPSASSSCTAKTVGSSATVGKNTNVPSIHYQSSVSRRGGKVALCPSPGRTVSNTPSQTSPSSMERRHNDISNVSLINNNRNNIVTLGDLSITPVKTQSQSLTAATVLGPSASVIATNSTASNKCQQQQQLQNPNPSGPASITVSSVNVSASTTIPTTATPRSSSPSRIPSLQPRKLSESMHHVNVSISTSTCSETASIPSSLCSSNSNTPDNHAKVNNVGQSDKNHHHQQLQQHQQQQHQFLRRTVSESTVNIKVENEGESGTNSCSTMNLEHQNSTNLNSDIKEENESYAPSTNIGNSNPNSTSTNKNIIANNTSMTNVTNTTIKNNRINNTSPVPARQIQPHQTRTPVRSPKNRSFNVDFGSPGIFLSPYLPSPPDSRKVGFAAGGGGGGGERGQKNATPTNFAKDFGKTDLSSSSFDATNVLPWLSPNSYSLFSPGGGIASATDTPGGMFSSLQTPRSPNANKLTLPLTNEVIGGGVLDTKKKVNGSISSMICVSPLASRKSTITNSTSSVATSAKNGKGGQGNALTLGSNAVGGTVLSQPDTPINFREVFASPKTDSKGVMIQTDQSNEIPTLGQTNDEMCTSLSLEKHMAERDVREDEDLNVLLRLAETTPNRKATEPKPTTRPFRAQFAYNNHSGNTPMYPMPSNSGEPPASLHLPFIGKNSGSTGKATKKPSESTTDDFSPPPLPIRSTSSSPTKRSKKVEEKGKAKSPFQKNTPVPTKGMYPYPPPHHPHHPGAYPPPPPPHYMPGPYYTYPHQGPGHPPPPPYTMYSNATAPPKPESAKKGQKVKEVPAKVSGMKRPISTPNTETKKRQKKPSSKKGGKRSRTTVTQPLTGPEREKSAATITAINAATGNKNDKAASLASAILRGVTMRPSGKWQAQLYYAGKSRYIGVFDTREKAALAYEIAREKLKTDKPASEQSAQSIKETEANVNAARKAAFEGVNEKDPRHGK